MTELDLTPIESKIRDLSVAQSVCPQRGACIRCGQRAIEMAEQVPALVAEVRRLRAELAGAQVEAVIADRTAQSTDPDVAHAAAFKLEMELRPWFGPRCIPDEPLRRVAAQVLRAAEWVRPAAPGCNCSATGGQGLTPTASREHADDCPAVTG